VRERNHDQLPTFGIGTEYDLRQWQAIFRQMMGYDLIRPDMERHGALVMTPAARPILRDEQSIELRKDTIVKAAKGSRRPAVKSLVTEEDEPLLSALKAKRRALAESIQAPAYVVFPDSTLIAMATTRPRDLDGFAQLSGVGAVKLKRYGLAFLEVINGAAQEVHPARQKLAGKPSGEAFDSLQAVQITLSRGENGGDKFMSCTSSTLAKIAETKPDSLTALEKIQGMGPQKTQRFGAAFLQVIANG